MSCATNHAAEKYEFVFHVPRRQIKKLSQNIRIQNIQYFLFRIKSEYFIFVTKNTFSDRKMHFQKFFSSSIF